MELQKQDDGIKNELARIFKNLSQLDVLQRVALEIQDIIDLEKDSIFVKKISQMIEEKNLSAIQTLGLFWDRFHSIDEKMTKEQWLKQIYHFCQFLSFPDTRAEFKNISLAESKLIYLFLLTYRQIIALQKEYKIYPFLSKYPLVFLSKKEIDLLEQPQEYYRFLNAFDQLFVYEMMTLSREIYNYNTIDHICGVHALALSLAKQIQKQGFPLDLGTVSGSSAGHDVGKYGCQISESKKVPYLHYYYTDLWFQKNNISYFGHIAVNHSVWDLELENLPLESLILIYADFRVKNAPNSDLMNINSLQEAFEIILRKLDNLDKKKEKRYRRVFAKLRDFEDFCLENGVNINLIPFSEKKVRAIKKQRLLPLLFGDEVIQKIKHLSLEHSFKLMFQLRNESSINSILESARSETNWLNLQEYLRIFSEYATYLNQNEKILVLKFLYDQLVFSEEGVRQKSARLIGYLISSFDEKYRKEIPDGVYLEISKTKSADLLESYLQLFIEPDYMTSELNQYRIRENLSYMLGALFKNSQSGQIIQYLQIVKKCYEKIDYHHISKNIAIYLIQALKVIPIFSVPQASNVFIDFLIYFMQHNEEILRVNALNTINCLLGRESNTESLREMCYLVLKKIRECSLIPAENYLRYKIIRKIKTKQSLINCFKKHCLHDIQKIDRMYLDNLKSSTDAIIKQIQIDMLTERAQLNHEETIYIALHFCNILKVSSHEPIRNYAGRALIKIIPYLNVEQKNDIIIELLKALEIDDYQYTKYIPYYLGQSIPFLPPREIDEFIDDLEQKIKVADHWTCTLLVRTIAVSISRYMPYRDRYQEDSDFFKKRLIRMLGVLMNGLTHHHLLVNRVTSRVIGREIFATHYLTLKEKNDIFKFIAKKFLNLLSPISHRDSLLFFTNSVALHQLYIFISDYHFYEGKMSLPIPDRVAFFPGSFDPFSLSHKEIVREIEKLGMEVYLSVDEFSWSKRTQPHLYRKNLINMSIADELNVYVYPENLPSNIANPNDLKMLKKIFHSKVYIVAGSDVLLNASAYSDVGNPNSVIHFPHIIFTRKPFHLSEKQQRKYQEMINTLGSEVIQLNLQTPFEEISSSQIRKNIDNHRDISHLVDPLVERYIYQFGLYQREPEYKSTLQKGYIKVEIIEHIEKTFIERIVEQIFSEKIKQKALDSMIKFSRKLNPRIILFKDTYHNNKILGFAAVHWVRSNLFFHEFENNNVCQFIRDHATGRTIVLDGVYSILPEENSLNIRDTEQIILTEALTFCVRKDYDYAVFKNMIPETNSPELMEVLKLFGFSELLIGKQSYPHYPIMVVDIRKPTTISLDTETLIKEPFNHSLKVIETIRMVRKKLQRAMTQLYPGHLLIPFNIDMINQSIIEKVCLENGVPTEQSSSQLLGPLMCVPFGKILHKMVVPNTVTKSLHTDKIFTPDMRHFKIDSFGYYLSLENQVKMIKSFNRAVLLIDDLLHKGYRLKALSPLLKREDIKVHKIIVGLLSGRGKELAMIQNRSIDGAYFIPNLRVWFNESDLYPFIGGDGLFRPEPEQGQLVRSINMILPFAYPVFLKGVNQETIYHFSEICIENAMQIIKALEEEYQVMYHRKLTLGHLGEVCLYPRYPDHGKYLEYNLSMATSMYLENDLELLYRIWQGGVKVNQKDLLLYPYSREFNVRKANL